MYVITADNNVFHNPSLDDTAVTCIGDSIEFKTEKNKAGSLTFVLPPNNVAYSALKKLKTVIALYQNNSVIWRGRVLDSEKDFYRRMTVTCEGALNYLKDSVVRPNSYSGTWTSILTTIINAHNSSVSAAQRLTLSVTGDTSDTHTIELEDYPITFDFITDEIVEPAGAFMWVEYATNSNMLHVDFRDESARQSNQSIIFGENLLDLSEHIDATEVFTVLIPIGENGLTISSVNGGKDYIEDASAISLFGRIVRQEKFDGIESASELLAAGQKFLTEGIKMQAKISCNAVDFRIMGVNTDRLAVGYQNEVISSPHGIDDWFTCTEITENLLNPSMNEYSFGYEYTTLTEAQAKYKSNFSKVATTSRNGLMSSGDKQMLSATNARTKQALNAIADGFYASGDTFSNTGSSDLYLDLAGVVSSGTKRILFMVTTPRSMANISMITVNSLKGGIRGSNGLVDGTTDSSDLSSLYTVAAQKATDNVIRITLAKSTEFTNVSNNTPIVVHVAMALTFN